MASRRLYLIIRVGQIIRFDGSLPVVHGGDFARGCGAPPTPA
jgi:hypothetical protein